MGQGGSFPGLFYGQYPVSLLAYERTKLTFKMPRIPGGLKAHCVFFTQSQPTCAKQSILLRTWFRIVSEW